MSAHWIVDELNGTIIYEQVDYIPGPRSSRVLADEIDGMNRTQAVRTLKTMYEKVTVIENSPKIFCQRELVKRS